MQTELDRARSKMQGSWSFGPRRSCLRVNPPPMSRCLPWDSPSETIWALWGGGNIVRDVTVSLRGTLVSTWVLFSSGLSWASAPVQRSVNCKEKEETEEFEEEGSKEDGEKAPAAKRRKVPKSQYIVLHLHEDMHAAMAYISRSNNNHFKNTNVVHFSAFVDLATKISAILPLWRLKLSVYFHLGEYYWKDFSSPDRLHTWCIHVACIPIYVPQSVPWWA